MPHREMCHLEQLPVSSGPENPLVLRYPLPYLADGPGGNGPLGG